MPDKNPPPSKPFASWLCEQSSGTTEAELTENLAELVNKVVDTGKKGSLTLVVTVEPMKGDPTMVVVKDEIKPKFPEFDRKPSIFWQKNGQLLRNDPNQRSIFDEITGTTVNSTTGEVQD